MVNNVDWKSWAMGLEDYLRRKGDYGYPSILDHMPKNSDKENETAKSNKQKKLSKEKIFDHVVKMGR